MPYIDIIAHDQADGRLKEIYDHLVKTRGKLAEVHMIQSLNPDSIMHHMDMYMGIMFGKSPLKRAQREMLAVVVSMANNCEYCQTHHGAALNHYWKDSKKLEQFKADFRSVSLSEQEYLLCEYAQLLTLSPNKIDTSGIITRIKAANIDDRTLLDAALVVSYFNFVNRMVLGLGVQLESDKGEGFKYK